MSKPLHTTKKFLFKNSDVIFENEILQVGVRGQATKYSMQVELYFGNKTNSRLINFTANILPPGDFDPGTRSKQSCAGLHRWFLFIFHLELRVAMEPMPSAIDPGAQVKQIGIIECLKDFRQLPKMTLSFL